jgi:hypothetical protein
MTRFAATVFMLQRSDARSRRAFLVAQAHGSRTEKIFRHCASIWGRGTDAARAERRHNGAAAD